MLSFQSGRTDKLNARTIVTKNTIGLPVKKHSVLTQNHPIIFYLYQLVSFFMYAIVDIETTGGYAANNAITEIAIVLHNGQQEIKRYETLVNPGMPIPRYVQALTGITDETIKDAPYFNEIAYDVFNLLQGNIFVAHNVNFDYSFLKYQFSKCGFTLNLKKLCTVRLGRKVFPDLPSYSLGNLCRNLEIPVSNRHRAGGDADATVLLFKKILNDDKAGHIELMLKGRSKEQYLPANLPAAEIEQLPPVPGVYYFHNQAGKIIYVGKAKNLLKRVTSLIINRTSRNRNFCITFIPFLTKPAARN
jgi:DNA polymerase-3 subunit epsilon